MRLEEKENPVVSCILLGDVQGLQQFFEDPEDPSHEKFNQMLLEQDAVGRTPLFLACMLGHIEVIQELAKYGVDVNQQTPRGYLPIHCAAAWGQLETLKTLVKLGVDIQAINFKDERAREISLRYGHDDCVEFLDLAEAKQALTMYITEIQQKIADPEKVQGRLNKGDKNAALNACKAKTDWMENVKNPTIQDFLDQKQLLEITMNPIFMKMNTPRPETGKKSKR